MTARKNDGPAHPSTHRDPLPRHTPAEWQVKCPKLQKNGNQLKGPCPNCGGDDRFWVNLKEPWAFGCRQCEDGAAILKAAFPAAERPRTRAARVEVARWQYTDANGDSVYHVRWDPKSFSFEPKGKTGRHWFPLLLEPASPKSTSVIWAEGEKAAEALQAAGYRAACGPYGAPNNQKCNFAPLTGCRVIMWPDDDKHGRTDANRVAAKLVGLAAEVLWIPTDGETGRDAADYGQDGIDEMVAAATAWNSSADDPQAKQEAAAIPARWFDIGRWVASIVLTPDFAYEVADGIRRWWVWNRDHWSLIPTNDTAMVDLLHEIRYDLAAQLTRQGSREAADMVAGRYWQAQVAGVSTEFNAGVRAKLRRRFTLPPPHIVAVGNGVLDLKTGDLQPHSPENEYLITAVTNGHYLRERLPELRTVIDRRLAPALPDEARREILYKALTLMVGGQAGGMARGSLLYLLGESGGGKGNTARAIIDSFGRYAMVGNIDAMFARGDINDTLATILEANPRIVIFHEALTLVIAKILSMTGLDDMSARGPHKPILQRRLKAGVIATAVDAPSGRMDTGAKRRLASVRFTGRVKARIPPSQATDDMTQAERDALVTVTLVDALQMWQGPDAWQGLPERDADTADAVREADVVEAAIDVLTDDDVGRTLSEILAEWQAADSEWTGQAAIVKLTPRALSIRLGKREDWQVCHRPHMIDGVQARRLHRPAGMAGECPRCNPEPQGQGQPGSPEVDAKSGVDAKTANPTYPYVCNGYPGNGDFVSTPDFASRPDGSEAPAPEHRLCATAGCAGFTYAKTQAYCFPCLAKAGVPMAQWND